MIVAGAGALGLVTALRLADAGAAVTLCDPAALSDNASGVAAGMLAPAFETVLDAGSAEQFELLTAARDLWPALARRIGLEEALDRSGAVLATTVREAEALAAVERRMQDLGLAPQRLAGAALRRLQPDLADDVVEGLFTAEDWRLPPGLVLAALAAAFHAAGGRQAPLRLQARPGGGFTLDGRPVIGPVVIAVGAETGLADAAPELRRLSPVKGQILDFDAGPTSGPVLRSFRGYVSPQPGGALAGATMELGRSDLTLDVEVLAGLRADAARLLPHLSMAPATGRAGVRAATPDGLPLVGLSAAGAPGREVVLCTGARRNGWLLAPLAAEVVVRSLTVGEAEPAFDPGRFR